MTTDADFGKDSVKRLIARYSTLILNYERSADMEICDNTTISNLLLSERVQFRHSVIWGNILSESTSFKKCIFFGTFVQHSKDQVVFTSLDLA
jgi:hypothetical protein